MRTGLTLYGYLDSGNGYKIRLLLAQLSRPYTYCELDITKGASRTPDFLRKNPNGRTPTLELEDGACFAESNAILWYLAEGSSFLPSEPLPRAQVLQWMFFEQSSHEPFVATARFIARHLPLAAHVGDLKPARSFGLRTGFIYRPDEDGGGPFGVPDKAEPGDIDVVSPSIVDLAQQLGA